MNRKTAIYGKKKGKFQDRSVDPTCPIAAKGCGNIGSGSVKDLK